MFRHVIVALFSISATDAVLAACPTTLDIWDGSTTGKVYVSNTVDIYNFVVFQAPAGSVFNSEIPVAIPRFSISTPLSSASDLFRLTHDDWLKVEKYRDESLEKAKGLPRSSLTYEQEVSGKEAERLNSASYDAAIKCYLAETKPISSQDRSSAVIQQDSKGAVPKAVSLPSSSESYDIATVNGYTRTSINHFLDGVSEQKVTKNQGKKFDTNAPIISSECVTFKNWGAGINHDVKQVKNSCSVPIAVTYCFFDGQAPHTCNRKLVGWGTTDIILPGGTALVVANAAVKGGRLKVHYYTCDMSDEDRYFCIKP